ncbi:MAG TPA: DUF2752 domain-containing protein [Blastocatellia bacterium]|nr:DUF2752 domain-containing protein [Blastocatellia bacterium]
MDQQEAISIQRENETPDAGREQAKGRRLAAILLAGLTLVFILSILFEPSEVRPDGQYFTICAFKQFTGLPCPGCGLTHSFCAIGRGDLMDGFSFNMLGPPLFACAILLWMRNAFFLFGWHRPVIFLDGLAGRFNAVKLFLLAFLIFGIIRILYVLVDAPSQLTQGVIFKVLSGGME